MSVNRENDSLSLDDKGSVLILKVVIMLPLDASRDIGIEPLEGS